MLNRINRHGTTMLRILCLSGVMMAPIYAFALTRASDESGVSHGVGLALLVTLQRGATF